MQQYRDSDAMALTLGLVRSPGVHCSSSEYAGHGPSNLNGHDTGPGTSNPASRTQSRCVGGQGLRLSACVTAWHWHASRPLVAGFIGRLSEQARPPTRCTLALH